MQLCVKEKFLYNVFAHDTRKEPICMVYTDSRFSNINFNGGNLSSDGGSILLLEYIERTGLKDQLAQIPFFDNRRLPLYSNSEIAYQMIARNLLGYFNQCD